MAALDPTKVRPKRDWCLVCCDKRQEMIGGIHLPVREVGAEIVMEKAGTVTAVGPGDKAPQLGIVPGARIIFRGFIKHAQPLETDTGLDYFLMAVDDIIGITEGDVSVGAFSRPAMHAVESVSADGSVTLRD
jgi:co-chaperonin GroES (HSP10)